MVASVTEASAVDLAAAIRRGERSPVDVVEACLDRIDAVEDRINAFRAVFADAARERAREAAAAVNRGEVWGPLHGVPVAIKDNADVAGRKTAAGLDPSLVEPAERDSVVVARLRDAGAVLVGKTHMPELGFGTTDSSWGAPTSTPFDPERNSGGSSGGSAAAVAAGCVPLALGTDGGGSVRIPSAWCGTVGLKPTFRRVPRVNRRPEDAFGNLMPFSEFGPITRSPADAGLMLSAMVGAHPRDPFSLPDDGTDYAGAAGRSVDDLAIAYSSDLGGFPVGERVAPVVEDAVDALATTGATVETASPDLPASHDEITDTWMEWAATSRAVRVGRLAQGGVDLLGADRDAVHPDYAAAAERAMEYGAVDQWRTSELRTEVLNAFADLFAEYDLLVAPTLAVPPVENATDGYTVGPEAVAGEAVDPHLGWCLTHPCNFTGHPAASVPAGLTDDGLPVGLQIIGPRFDEGSILSACGALERVNPWEYPSW